MKRMRRTLSLVPVLTLASACALTNKADPLNLRYFAPHVEHRPSQAISRALGEPVVVRIDGVEAAAHLTESIAYRKNESELAYYEEFRFTEIPNVYLDRAIGEVLFHDGTFRRGLTEGAYSLAVTLEAFDELKYGTPRVRVATRVWVGDERVVLSERRLVVEEAIGDGGSPQSALMAAFARALQKTAHQVREQLESTIEQAKKSAPLPVEGEPELDGPEPDSGVPR